MPNSLRPGIRNLVLEVDAHFHGQFSVSYALSSLGLDVKEGQVHVDLDKLKVDNPRFSFELSTTQCIAYHRDLSVQPEHRTMSLLKLHVTIIPEEVPCLKSVSAA